MASSVAVQQLRLDEGKRSKAYSLKGVLHIGIGFNLDRGDGREQLILAGVKPADVDSIMKEGGAALTEDQIENLFQNSLLQSESHAQNYAGGKWDNLPQGVKDVLVNMSYQLGAAGLREFTDMKKALDKGDWKGVQREMADSKWARKDTPKRAKRLIGSIDDLKQPEPESPEVQVNPKASMKEAQRQGTAARLGSMLSKAMMVDRMGKALSDSQKEAAKQEDTVKPKIQKLEQGLFEDDTGKKFFVNSKNQMLELGEDNQPTMVIDPSSFDMSKVNEETL